jgi:hypothetical protein
LYLIHISKAPGTKSSDYPVLHQQHSALCTGLIVKGVIMFVGAPTILIETEKLSISRGSRPS